MVSGYHNDINACALTVCNRIYDFLPWGGPSSPLSLRTEDYVPHLPVINDIHSEVYMPVPILVILVWPIAILFTWLSRIQLNLTNAFKTDNASNYSVDVSATLAQLWFVMKPSDMKYFYDMAREYDSLEEAEKLLDTVWKVSRPFFKYSIWAHSPHSKAQKGGSYVPYKDTNEKKPREIDPKDWRVLLRE